LKSSERVHHLITHFHIFDHIFFHRPWKDWTVALRKKEKKTKREEKLHEYYIKGEVHASILYI